MGLPNSLLNCLCGDTETQLNTPPHHHIYTLITEKPPLEPSPSHGNPPTELEDDQTDDDVAKILKYLLHVPLLPRGADHTTLVAAEVSIQDWTPYLAERLLHALEETFKEGADKSRWGEAITEAYNRAVEFVKQELSELWEFAQDHPYEVAASVVLTVLALGVLARLVPLFVRVLGFGELGPVEGSFAAWWQRLYGGYVPKGSLWSFLQRMGMTWE